MVEPSILPVVRNRFYFTGMDSAFNSCFRFGFRNRRFRRLFSKRGKTFENRFDSFRAANRRNEKEFGQSIVERKSRDKFRRERFDAKFGAEFGKRRRTDAASKRFDGETNNAVESAGKSIERCRNDLLLRRGNEKGQAVLAPRQRRRSLLAARRSAGGFAAG